MILYRERIEKVRNEKCVLCRELDGRKILLAYGRSVLSPATWQRYAGVVQQRQQNVDNAVLGHVSHQVPPVHVQLPPQSL
jgi:hypothetical protein